MPIDNYLNPAQLLPQVDYKPSGALAGFLAADQQKDYRVQMDLANTLQNLELQKRQGEVQDYQTLRPDALAAEQARARATAQTAVPRAQADLASVLGQNTERDLKNTATAATQKSDIARKLAENATAMGDEGRKRLAQAQAFAMQAKAYLDAAGESPATTAALQQMAQASGQNLNDPHVQAILKSPKAAAEWAKTFGLADAQVQAKIEEERLKQEAEYKRATEVARIHAAAQRYAADAAASSANKSEELMFKDVFEALKTQFKDTDETLLRAQARFQVSEARKTMSTGTTAINEKTKADAKALADAKSLLSKVDPNSEIAKVLTANIKTIEGALLTTQTNSPGNTVNNTQNPAKPPIAAKVEAQGEKYEPDKFDYMEVNGQVLKRPK